MKAVNMCVLALPVLLAGHAAQAGALSIRKAEEAGFKPDQQQHYQMIGAEDGWSGRWAGEIVELYEYQDAASVDASVFESAVAPGNPSGWAALCEVENLLMLSKGEEACAALEGLPR